ncbi:MAG: hypothetical protein PHE51_10130, partial [Eubacteriales bacterium]|nr:hypothetical protein [Eubacteriales bacterium]
RLDASDVSISSKANQAALEVEKQRINNLIAVEASTDNAETADIRVGVDGTTFASAGDAVRGQVGKVSNNLNKLKNVLTDSANLVNEYNIYHEFNILGNPPNIQFRRTSGGRYIAIVPVKPDTIYTISRTDTGLEGGYYYFKVLAIEQTVEEVLSLALGEYLDLTNSSLLYMNTGAYVKTRNVTTPSRCATLLVQVSKNIMPKYIEVVEGTYNDFQFNSYREAITPIGDVYSKKETYSRSEVYSKAESDERFWKVDEYKISISKISDTRYKIDFGKYYTNLVRVVRQDSNSDLWNVLGIYCDSVTVVTAGTDIIGPIQELNQSDFMGGVHGDELNTALFITCDGVEWDRESTVKADVIQVIMVSKLFRVDSKEHVYNRYVSVEFTHNRMRVRNMHTCIVNDSIINRATNGGLIAIQNTILTAVSMPNYFSSTAPTASPSNGSHENVDGTLYWTNGSITVRNLIGKEYDTFIGFLAVFASENPIRNKIYLDVIKGTQSGTRISNGQNILGEFEYIFN